MSQTLNQLDILVLVTGKACTRNPVSHPTCTTF